MASVAKHPEATVVADEQYVGIFFSLQISVNLLTPSWIIESLGTKIASAPSAIKAFVAVSTSLDEAAVFSTYSTLIDFKYSSHCLTVFVALSSLPL